MKRFPGDMHLTWLDPHHLAPRDIAQAVGLLEDARVVDAPHEMSQTASTYAAHLRCGWDGDPPMNALARDASGRTVGLLDVHLPRWDNTHLGFVTVTVAPQVRRRGTGRRLFDVGIQRVRDAGRRLLASECLEDGTGVPFLEAAGLKRASVDVQRRQDLRSLDYAVVGGEYDNAERAAAAYHLERVPAPTPENLIADVVHVTQAINDAPRDDFELEDEVFSAERVRAFEAAQAAQGRRIYRLAARGRATGGLAGHTVVAVDAERPWHAWQYDTSVVREHRGHRLGLLLKTGMLRWLAEEEPQVRTLDTWNAESNAHMIEVNEVLGYRVVARGFTWQLHL